MPKWWSTDLKRRCLFGIRHPYYTLIALVRDALALDERFLAGMTGVSPTAIRRFLNEPFEDIRFFSRLRAAENSLRDMKGIGADLYAKRVLLQYAMVRAQKPKVILETGVGNGVSSVYLLQALHVNQVGELHSIEIGDSPYVPPGRSTGWIVSDYLRVRWKLHICDARECLPRVLAQLGLIDMFIHDSLHTPEHMQFEYEHAYPHLRGNGILISDDALGNSAFNEFVQRVGAPTARVIRGIGFLQKPLV